MKKNYQGANQANWRGTIQDSDSAAISALGHRRLTGDNWYHLPCKYRVSSLAEPVDGKRARARRIAERNRRCDNYVLVLEKGEAPVNSTLRSPRKKPPAATSSCVKIRRRADCVRILAWIEADQDLGSKEIDSGFRTSAENFNFSFLIHILIYM